MWKDVLYQYREFTMVETALPLNHVILPAVAVEMFFFSFCRITISDVSGKQITATLCNNVSLIFGGSGRIINPSLSTKSLGLKKVRPISAHASISIFIIILNQFLC